VRRQRKQESLEEEKMLDQMIEKQRAIFGKLQLFNCKI
jgi:hypothetical protein